MTPSAFYEVVLDKIDAKNVRGKGIKNCVVQVERATLRDIRRQEMESSPLRNGWFDPLPEYGYVGTIFGFPMYVVNQDGYGIQVFAKRDFSKCY